MPMPHLFLPRDVGITALVLSLSCDSGMYQHEQILNWLSDQAPEPHDNVQVLAKARAAQAYRNSRPLAWGQLDKCEVRVQSQQLLVVSPSVSSNCKFLLVNLVKMSNQLSTAAVTNWKIAPIASVQRQQRRVIMKLQKDTKSVVPFQWLNQVRLKIQWMSSTNDQSNLFGFSNQKYIISSIIILWIHRVQFMSKREPTGMGGSPSHWTAY